MLVKCTLDQHQLVRSARGVRRFLGNDGHPQTVDDDRLEVIRLVEAEKANDERLRAIAEHAAAKARAGGRSGIVWHFAQGDQIRIKTGPFAGFYAELTDAVDVHDRIRAFVSLFGRQSLVELSAFEIEKAV
jgi:transcriptional antiterminator NusG